MEAMLAAGCTAEQIVAAMKAELAADAREALEQEKSKQDRTRVQTRERVRDFREREKLTSPQDCNASNALQSVTSVTTPPSLPLSPTPSISNSTSPAAAAAAARETTPDEILIEQALNLADRIFELMGIDRAFVPPDWCGLAMWLKGKLEMKDGWRPELVLLGAERLAARMKQRGRPHPTTYRYLSGPIEDEHRDAQQAFPVLGVVGGKDHTHANHRRTGGARTGGFASAAIDYAIKQHGTAEQGVDPPDHREGEAPRTVRSRG